MLKLDKQFDGVYIINQPPSGGCVLKLKGVEGYPKGLQPAAFRRLCVETLTRLQKREVLAQPPSGGCVLKRRYHDITNVVCCPAAFRRLCVETDGLQPAAKLPLPSRLQAAVC